MILQHLLTEEKLSQNKDEEALEAVVDDVVDDEEEEDKCSLSVITLRGAVETFFAKKFFERYVCSRSKRTWLKYG